jgi:hypothetical protein
MSDAGDDAEFLRYRVVNRDGILVVVPIDPLPTLTNEEVRRLTRGLRERRIR